MQNSSISGSLICVLYIGLQKDDHVWLFVTLLWKRLSTWLPPLKLHTCYSKGKLNLVVIMVELENLQYKILLINDFNKKVPCLVLSARI